jgi:hypothetical protein
MASESKSSIIGSFMNISTNLLKIKFKNKFWFLNKNIPKIKKMGILTYQAKVGFVLLILYILSISTSFLAYLSFIIPEELVFETISVLVSFTFGGYLSGYIYSMYGNIYSLSSILFLFFLVTFCIFSTGMVIIIELLVFIISYSVRLNETGLLIFLMTFLLFFIIGVVLTLIVIPT